MRTAFLFLIVLCSISPRYSFGRDNQLIHKFRLGNVKKTETTYNKYNTQQAAISYDEILANPRLLCDIAGCEVAHFTITVWPAGNDIYGPFSTSGPELTALVKTKLQELKDNKTKAKIIVEDIQITRNGKNEPIHGALFYQGK